MSTSEGAFETVLPVAAHMPGGGSASISFMLALRILLDAEDALVDVRARCLPFGASSRPSGCGKGTGVETVAGEVECEFGAAMFYEIKTTTGDSAFCNFGRIEAPPACAPGRQPSWPTAGGSSGWPLGNLLAGNNTRRIWARLVTG
jgi:hypothetical protein